MLAFTRLKPLCIHSLFVCIAGSQILLCSCSTRAWHWWWFHTPSTLRSHTRGLQGIYVYKSYLFLLFFIFNW